MHAPLVLSIRSLRKNRDQGLGEAYSLRVPALDIRLGEKLLITGPSGAGKSTLLDMLGMVLKPDSVDTFLFHPDVRALAAEHDPGNGRIRQSAPCDVAGAWLANDLERLALWRRNVGYVLQTGGLLPFISIRDNILVPVRLRNLADTNAAADIVNGLAQWLGIEHLLNKLPGQLSVGERQRAAIARALSAGPSLVLADEPTAALDPHNAAGVLDLFSRIAAELGITLIMVTHAPEQMEGMGFRRLAVSPAAAAPSEGTVMELRYSQDS